MSRRIAGSNLFGNEPVQPWWGLVTDMNEFRLYWWDRAPHEYHPIHSIRRQKDMAQSELFEQRDLLPMTRRSRFDRFLFTQLFCTATCSLSPSGRPALSRLVERQ